jgi:hypothetical protein
MVRKQIYLDKATDVRLKREAKRRGMSQAALIRELVDRPADDPVLRPTPSEQRRRLEALRALRDVRGRVEKGRGSGWKFNREELYEERLDRIHPD